MVALVATLSFAAVAHAEVPAIKAGDVQLGEFSTGLNGTVVEPAWVSIPKACNRASARKRVDGGQVAARTHLGQRVWVPIDDVVTICRAKGKTILVGSGNDYAAFLGSTWRKRGRAVKGAVTGIDFDKFEVSILVSATVELIGTCSSGHVYRRDVKVNPSMFLRGFDVAEHQGSAAAVRQYVRSFLEWSAADLAVLNHRIDEPCPEPEQEDKPMPVPTSPSDTSPPTTPVVPVYAAPTMSCFFPEGWIIPVTPGYEFTSTSAIWCRVTHDDKDPVDHVRAVSPNTEPARFIPVEYAHGYASDPCPADSTCFRTVYALAQKGLYTFTVTATTKSGQQVIYKGNAQIYEGYPGGGGYK